MGDIGKEELEHRCTGRGKGDIKKNVHKRQRKQGKRCLKTKW